MDKKFKKKVETQLVIAIEGILSRINTSASASAKKKIKEAGKMIAKKFAREVSTTQKKNAKAVVVRNTAKKKPVNKAAAPKRDRNGRFEKKKK